MDLVLLTLEGFLCEPWAMLVGHLVLPDFGDYPER